MKIPLPLYYLGLVADNSFYFRHPERIYFKIFKYIKRAITVPVLRENNLNLRNRKTFPLITMSGFNKKFEVKAFGKVMERNNLVTLVLFTMINFGDNKNYGDLTVLSYPVSYFPHQVIEKVEGDPSTSLRMTAF